MAHEFDRGVRSETHGQAWHGLFTLVDIPTTEELIRQGYDCGTWPCSLAGIVGARASAQLTAIADALAAPLPRGAASTVPRTAIVRGAP